MSLFDVINIPTVTRQDWRPPEPPVLTNVDEIIIDLETTGLRWWDGHRVGGIGYCLPDGTTGYLPIRHRVGHNIPEERALDWARQELRGKRVKNIATKFDIHHFREWGCDLEAQGCTVADIAFDAALLDDNRQKFSLEVLCQDFLPESERKVLSIGKVELDPNRMMDYPADMIATRCEADCRQVFLLSPIFERKIADENLGKVRQLEYDCIFPVVEMERLGAPINVELLHRWTRESEVVVNRLLKEIAAEVGFLMNPDRPADWQRMFEHLHLPLPTNADKAVSFADPLLKNIDHPAVQKARKTKKLMSLRQKYLLPYSECVGADGLLRYQLHQLRQDDYGTVSGRFSSSDKNIQQVMDAEKQVEEFGSEDFLIRQLFIPKEGLFLSADAKQIEFRIFAHYSKSPKILKAYSDNPLISFHDIVHGELIKFQSGLKYKTAKNCNFARMYGAGKAKLALMIGLPEDEAEKFTNIYDKMFPEAKQQLNRAMKLAESGKQCVQTFLGRRARFPDKKRTHKALNAAIQGSAADVMKQKIIELHRCRKETGFVMRYTVHDEVCGDIPSLEAAKVVHNRVLNWQSFKTRVPILWSASVGPDWAHVKDI